MFSCSGIELDFLPHSTFKLFVLHPLNNRQMLKMREKKTTKPLEKARNACKKNPTTNNVFPPWHRIRFPASRKFQTFYVAATSQPPNAQIAGEKNQPTNHQIREMRGENPPNQ